MGLKTSSNKRELFQGMEESEKGLVEGGNFNFISIVE